MTNGNRKGKTGELDFCNFMKELGYEARRSQQFCGANGDADVISPLFKLVHPEVKRVEVTQFYKWFEQAEKDARCDLEIESKAPVVFHRKNRGKWMAFMDAAELLAMIDLANKYLELCDQGDVNESA